MYLESIILTQQTKTLLSRINQFVPFNSRIQKLLKFFSTRNKDRRYFSEKQVQSPISDLLIPLIETEPQRFFP